MERWSRNGTQGGRKPSEEKRESILEAAIRVFSRGGFEASSMDLVALEAGASKRTVYNYFPSKEILLREIAARFGREMRAFKRFEYDPAVPIETQLGRFADAELEVVRNERWMGMIRLLVAAFVRSPELARASVSREPASEDPLADWMRAAARAGKLDAPEPAMAAAVFRALLGGAYTWPAVYGGGTVPDGGEALKRELVETFLARYRPSDHPAERRAR